MFSMVYLVLRGISDLHITAIQLPIFAHMMSTRKPFTFALKFLL